MPQVRQNPLPVGRYWIFVQGQAQDILKLWFQQHTGTVEIEKTEPSGGVWPFLSAYETFYIFYVTSPTTWPRGIGFPNADPTAQKAADVMQRPPAPTVKETVKDIAETASEAATNAIGVTALLAVIVLWALSRNR